MLQLLHIENIAVIERADISFRALFNALTGETGAGKSIVIDALGAVLGQRTSRELIRTGAEKAFVSAVFDAVDPTLPALLQNDIAPEPDGTLLLQREIGSDGKNGCRINGRPVTVAQLRAVGGSLLDIHGQHDGALLLDEEQHGAYLDRFGKTERELSAYGDCYRAMQEIAGAMRSLRMNETEKERRMDTLRHQIAELDRAGLKEGEEEELLERREILRNAEKFTEAFSSAEYALGGGDDTPGAVSLLREAQSAFHRLAHHGERFEQIEKRLESISCEAYDLVETVRDMRGELDFSPQELDAVEGRTDQLYRLKKKYGASVAEMLAYLEKCRLELDGIEYADDRLAQLEKKYKAQREKTLGAARALSQARRSAARILEQRVTQELRELDMGKVCFSIDFAEKEADAGGIDVVRFLMSANTGEVLKPINRIASGGELARIMLALKNVLSEQDHVMTMVFDEVDTGVSGRAAQRVAEKMAKVSRKKQVLCVTHLPQLAAMADTHFCVQKGEENGRTYTSVLALDRAERRAEIARLTGGSHVTDIQLAGAEELLSAADSYKLSLCGGDKGGAAL